jgi:hypothetical protein
MNLIKQNIHQSSNNHSPPLLHSFIFLFLNLNPDSLIGLLLLLLTVGKGTRLIVIIIHTVHVGHQELLLITAQLFNAPLSLSPAQFVAFGNGRGYFWRLVPSAFEVLDGGIIGRIGPIAQILAVLVFANNAVLNAAIYGKKQMIIVKHN